MANLLIVFKKILFSIKINKFADISIITQKCAFRKSTIFTVCLHHPKGV